MCLGRPGLRYFYRLAEGFVPSAHMALYTLLGKEHHLHKGREHRAGYVASYMWSTLADQRCRLYLVGNDLGHPEELD